MDSPSRILIAQIVGYLLIVDGLLTDEETTFLYALFEELNLDDEASKTVTNAINVDFDVDGALDQLDKKELEFLFERLKKASSIDGAVASSEAALIEKVELILALPENV